MFKSKKTDSLLFKFGAMFALFTLFILVVAVLATFYTQTRFYRKQSEETIRAVANYFQDQIQIGGETFADFQAFVLENRDDMHIPLEASSYTVEKADFEKAFAAKYPGQVFEIDVQFRDMDYDLQMLFARYYMIRWILIFEGARESFDIPYTYYMIPVEGTHDVIYFFDVERAPDDFDPSCLYLCDTVEENPEELSSFYATWEAGQVIDEMDEFRNEWGHTLSCYAPVIIDGQKMGVVGVDADLARSTRTVLIFTTLEVYILSIVYIIAMGVLLTIVNKKYIKKLTFLQDTVREYTKEKDVNVAEELESNVEGRDEIAVLSLQVSSMIKELQNHIESIVSISGELDSAKEYANELSEAANRDVMTGLGNKAAYLQASDRLQYDIKLHRAQFGVVMIDLNYLKKLNDTFGHEKGDLAIQKTASIIKDVFRDAEAYRIGGDEFVVLVDGWAFPQMETMIEDFKRHLDAIDSPYPWEKISAAVGYAIFDMYEDTSVHNVFERADDMMYENKKAMKAEREE